MKVLIFSQHFYPESFRVNEVAKNLVERGIEVDVVTGTPNYPGGKIYPNYKRFPFKKEVWQGMSICRLPIFLRGRASAIELSFNYLSFVISGIFLTPVLLRRKKYDLIFCYATSPFIQVIPAVFISWIKGCKLVVNVQDLWPESLSATGYIKNQLILRLVEAVVDWIYKNSNILLAQSNSFKNHIQEKVKNANVIYWPNSVDLLFISKEYKKGEITHNFENKFSVLFAGNIGKAQSIDTILKAAVALRKYSEIEIIFAAHLVHCIKNKIVTFNKLNEESLYVY
jgi:hypothetical protein